MRMTYDASSDAAYLVLGDRDLQRGEAVYQSDLIPTPTGDGTIILDFDGSGRLLGIEVLAASKVVPAEVLRQAGPV